MSDLTPEQIKHQIYMLHRSCGWQRSQGTSRDNGYPYGKHLPDCDICRSAELITVLQAQVDALEAGPRYHHPDCNWWKWDWRYSWHEASDCCCNDCVVMPAEAALKD